MKHLHLGFEGDLSLTHQNGFNDSGVEMLEASER